MELISKEIVAEQLRKAGYENAACIALSSPTVTTLPPIRCKDCANFREKMWCVAWQHKIKSMDGYCSEASRAVRHG